ncbi:MAG: PDZ domain-containing protein, partial [Chitinophagales bacterium]
DQENYTSSLWIAEGFTSYYDDLIVKRCGLMSTRDYLDILQKNIAYTLNAPGDAIQSIGESGFDAWIKYYRQNENTYNAQVNYYTKGSVLAMLLDLMIITGSQGAYHLDHVMREAYHTFYVQQDAGYSEDAFRAILEKYCGHDLRAFYADHVFGTKPVDPRPLLQQVGVQMVISPATDDLAMTGYTLQNGNVISFIRANSAAAQAGLQVGDEIIAINNYRHNDTLLNILLHSGTAPLHYLVDRKGRLEQYMLTPGNNNKIDVSLELTGEANTLLAVWLESRNSN